MLNHHFNKQLNMKNQIKNIFALSSLFVCLLSTPSCTEIVHKEPVQYSAHVDSVVPHAGYGKVNLEIYVSNPKIERVRVYWDSRSQSKEIYIDGAGVYPVTIENLSASTYDFTVLAYDAFKYESLPIIISSTAYDEEYVKSLWNRGIVKATHTDGVVSITWSNPVPNEIRSEITYTDNLGQTQTIKAPPTQDLTVIDGFGDWRQGFTCSTLVLLDPTSIDTIRVAAKHQSIVDAPPPIFAPNLAGNVGILITQFNTDPSVQALDKVTYETWVKFTQWSTVNANIQSIMGNEHATEGMLLRIRNSGDLHINFFGVTDILTGKCSLNQWTHLAAVYDGTTIKLYMNFQEVSSRSAPGNIVNLSLHHANDVSFAIGQSVGNRYLYGQLKETRIWRTARTLDEITANNCGLDPETPGLIAYWKFTDGSGSAFKDSSPNGFDLQTATPFNWEAAPHCGDE
jgi:hypothetical protein